MEPTHILKLTTNEINVLQQLIHRACLHSGLDVAEAAATLNRKLNEAKQQPPTEVE